MLNIPSMRYTLAFLAVLGLTLIAYPLLCQRVDVSDHHPASCSPDLTSPSPGQPHRCNHCSDHQPSAKSALRGNRFVPAGVLWENRMDDPSSAAISQTILGDAPDEASYLQGSHQIITLEDGTLIPVDVDQRFTHADGTIAVSGTVKSHVRGRLHMQWNERDRFFIGHIEFTNLAVAYEITRSDDGTAVITRHSVADLVCAEVNTTTGIVSYGLPPVNEMETEGVDESSSTEEAPSLVPALNSYPSASACIYLDFDGEHVTGTSWGSNINAAATGYSASKITDIWKRVAADMEPFNLNVTTDESVYLNAPASKRIRCIITPSNEWYGSSTAGGVAKYNSFTWSGDTPCWVFSDNLANGTKYIAEACSHEVGHTFGLSHDGKSSTTYYAGHGSGSVGWAPIMGNGYFKTLTQWSKGEYSNATNTQDDLSIITSANNGFGYRDDDHYDQASGATTMTPDAANLISGSGVIETRNDADVFTFESGAGNITLDITPGASHGNLDIQAELYNADGDLVTTANPSAQLNASIQTNVSQGTYFLHIRATGYGSADTGSTDYASLGSYAISGTVAAPATPTPYELTVASLPENQRAPQDDPDGDGLKNLTEHALGTDPGSANTPHHFTSAEPSQSNPSNGIDFLIDLPENIPSDVICSVEATCTLSANDWTSIAIRDTAGIWSGSADVAEETRPDGTPRFRVSESPETPWTCRFIRVSFSLTP